MRVGRGPRPSRERLPSGGPEDLVAQTMMLARGRKARENVSCDAKRRNEWLDELGECSPPLQRDGGVVGMRPDLPGEKKVPARMGDVFVMPDCSSLDKAPPKSKEPYAAGSMPGTVLPFSW